jgi:SAM-dependent methyltransferase
MTSGADWTARVGTVWAEEWRRTECSFADFVPHLDTAIATAAPDDMRTALDIGCGIGATAAALALARPHARVTGADLSADLIAVARDHHRRANLDFRHADALEAAAHLGPLDLFVSRHGVMFFADPVAAFARLHHAARPGAPLVFSCFRDRSDNPWASTLVHEVTGVMPLTASGYAPGPFAFADPALTSTILTNAGWTVDRQTRVDFSYLVGEGDDPMADALTFFRRIGPLAGVLRDAADPAAAVARLKTALERYRVGNTIACPASAWIWQAHA